MAYIVKQKIKDRIYLYRVEAYWDKDKKQSRQKRTYIGPEEPKNKMYKKNLEGKGFEKTELIKNIVHKNFGNIIFLSTLINNLNIKGLIQKHLLEDSEDIFGLIMYEIINNEASYLYPYWQENHHLPNNRKLSSSEISSLYHRIGENQKAMLDFQKDWIQNIASNDAVFFDITSFSSYSKNIDTVEMGYNRDGEKLKQINMGVAFSNTKSLPLFYKTYPGSIVDVSTLKNTAKYMQAFGITDYMFVLDRGFYSGLNITDLKERDIDFLIPVPFSVKASRELIKRHKKELHNQKNYFVNGKETLSYIKSEISINNYYYDAHIFLNEKIELEQRHKLIQELKNIETRISKTSFDSAKKATAFKKENIKNSFQNLFKWDKESNKIKISSSEFNKHIAKFGYFILITNKKELTKDFVLSKYRDKDEVEKAFNIVKNEMDGNRLRVHSQTNTDAKLFVRFLALIVHSEIIRVMRKNDMFKKFSVKELMLELKKIKRTKINSQIIISEVSKKQKEIYTAFGIDWRNVNRY